MFLLCTLILSVEPVEDKSEDTKSLMQGPPGSGNVLCCEVCGKYGLPQDFSASGRFCSLSCVGCYTGRRNKGREFSKHTKIPNGRIIKRKKKKGRKPGFKKAILHNPVSTQSVEVLRIWYAVLWRSYTDRAEPTTAHVGQSGFRNTMWRLTHLKRLNRRSKADGNSVCNRSINNSLLVTHSLDLSVTKFSLKILYVRFRAKFLTLYLPNVLSTLHSNTK